MNSRSPHRLFRWGAVAWVLVVFVGAGVRVLADCSSYGLPFSDLGSETTFCAAIAEAYYSGLTNGTTATTYSPGDNVTREQMAAFITRTLDASLVRGSRRAALDQWWTSTPHYDQASLGLTTVGVNPILLKSDGADVWIANGSGTVSRVRSSDGRLLETWTGADNAYGVLVAMGRVFVTGSGVPSSLYMIDPSQTAGAVTTVASNLGAWARAVAFDGNNIWTANYGGTIPNQGSISIVTPGATTPWAVTTVTAGFDQLQGILFDGSNMWVTDLGAGALLKLNSSGGIIQTIPINEPADPAFDGHNIWVPSFAGNSLTVVRASDGVVLKTFSVDNGDGNGLNEPNQAAFDGQRIVVTNALGGLSVFKASDLSVIGNPSTSGMSEPWGICSDGSNFWVGDTNSDTIGRF